MHRLSSRVSYRSEALIVCFQLVTVRVQIERKILSQRGYFISRKLTSCNVEGISIPPTRVGLSPHFLILMGISKRDLVLIFNRISAVQIRNKKVISIELWYKCKRALHFSFSSIFLAQEKKGKAKKM